MPGMQQARRKRQQEADKFQKRKRRNEEISSDSEDEAFTTNGHDAELDDNEMVETALEKRYRLAKEYLKQVEEEEKEKAESLEVDHDTIAHRLKEDALEQAGRLHRKVADECIPADASEFRILRGHKLPPTCLRVSGDGRSVVSGSKDGAIIKWDLESGKRLQMVKGHSAKQKDKIGHHGDVACLALSADGKLLCSAGMDSSIRVWDYSSMELVKTFSGHRGRVSGLAYREGHNQLFSCGHDRSLKIWNLDEMGYVDTMYGHQDAIIDVDSLIRERAITCGGRDRSIRIWKVAEESQLVFHAHRGCGSIECVRLINEDHFVSGADDGSLSVWSALRKKPVCVVAKAHAQWVTAVATQRFTDLIGSGSWDGQIKLWRCQEGYKELALLHTLKVDGFVNAMAFTPELTALVCAVGREHKNGRWWRNKDIKNALVVCPLRKVQATAT